MPLHGCLVNTSANTLSFWGPYQASTIRNAPVRSVCAGRRGVGASLGRRGRACGVAVAASVTIAVASTATAAAAAAQCAAGSPPPDCLHQPACPVDDWQRPRLHLGVWPTEFLQQRRRVGADEHLPAELLGRRRWLCRRRLLTFLSSAQSASRRRRRARRTACTTAAGATANASARAVAGIALLPVLPV